MSLKEIQNNMEYQKVVLDQRLRYYEPNGERVYKTFADEISNSLSSNQKSINPKFFYDEKGSHLFEKICTLPEYYLTNAEISILNQLDGKILPHLDGDFRLVELGSGSSTKTRILIQILERLQTYVEYIPIDISRILKASSRILQSDFKRLHITGIIDEY
ncbi:MAG: L-histidine N(alpha)-methyltransferase, partial [Candidatus Nitrosopelagicus sp.]